MAQVMALRMKKWALIIVLIVLGTALVTAGVGYLWFKRELRKRLPQISGEIGIQGLKEDVEIIRDSYGIPHIYARNEADLFLAFGFAVAQDRFWQMDFYRRLGQGRLSEIFGKDLLEVDRYIRTLSAGGVNPEVPEEVLFALEAFAKGVNAYLESHADRLPIEFTLLSYRPEPWSVDDYLSIVKVANLGLSMGWRVDLTAARILDKVGEEKLRDAFPGWPGDAPLVIPDETRSLSGLSNPMEAVMQSANGLIPISVPAASNNWVVSGRRSASGKPILANDPHLELTNPSLFWEVHLVCPTIDVSGVAVPGTPGISIGHNRHVAWGFTNVMLDDVDFYIERINPKNPRQYWYKDRWEDVRVVKETIRVKGEEPITVEVLLTRHGPVIDWLETGSQGQAVSARWSFMELPQPAKSTYLLMKAQSVDDAVEALRSWTVPAQNLVFADTSGNIAYFCCAAIPIRSQGDGLLPVPGWTGEYEWYGYVPFEERPHVINPDMGFIATANNKIVSNDYPHVIGCYWEPMDRITRIYGMLTAKDTLSVEDMMRMQQDVYSVFAAEMTPKLLEVLKVRSVGPRAEKAKEILSQWDFRMNKDSVGACLFEVTYRNLIENIFKDELGDSLFEAYLETGFFPPRALRKILREESSPWIDNVDTPERETMADILAETLTEMLSELEETLGNNVEKWTWGEIHSLTLEHPLGKKRPLNWLFNMGPFPVGGDNLTVNMGWYPYKNPYKVQAGPSMRMIVDLSDLDRSLRVLPTGESGQLGSPHCRDQMSLYLEGRYHPDWTNRSDVEKHAEGVLILKPER